MTPGAPSTLRLRRARLGPLASLLFICVGCPACLIIHSTRNAPGLVELEQPPARIAEPTLAAPKDPGEHLLVLSTGGFAGGGGRLSSKHGVAGLGLEASLFYGRDATSHDWDTPVELWIRPRTGFGLNLGWTAFEHEDEGGQGTGPFYLEAQVHLTAAGFAGLAAGYAVHPVSRDHGLQATLFWNFVYARVTHLWDRGTELQFGVVLKWRAAWVWSR